MLALKRLIYLFVLMATVLMLPVALSDEFSENEENVIKAYIAYYGRAPDLDGFTFWSDALDSQNGDLTAILDAFGTSKEFDSNFGSFSNEELIINLYQQILGRAPEDEGLSFFTASLDNQTRSLQNIAMDIINGAQNNDLVYVNSLLTDAEQALSLNDNKNIAARFLAQSTFGPTTDSIEELLNIGTEQWLENQYIATPSLHAPSVLEIISPAMGDDDGSAYDRRMETWWTRSVMADDQLRQRIAFALSQIFVISEVNDEIAFYPQGSATYYDTLILNSFGNFRDLLEAITLNPAMGVYLSMLDNEKPNPEEGIRADENFAREIMQLFTIGLVQLNQDGSVITDEQGQAVASYSLDDIKNLARVFTGWSWKDAENLSNDEIDPLSPMEPIEENHDTDEKVLFNNTVIIPAGGDARTDLNQALDVLFNHPNVGPFFGQQLIQRLVTSNPSPEYIARVSAKFADNGFGVRGDMKAVISAVLLDSDALLGYLTYPDTFGKLREPVLRMTHLWRAFNGRSENGSVSFTYPQETLSQSPLRAPSVFNFYRPDHVPSGELHRLGIIAPEFQITNESSIIQLSNFLADSIHYRFEGIEDSEFDDVLLNLDKEALLAENPIALVEHLDLLLMSGQMPASMKQMIVEHLEEIPYLLDDVQAGILRVLDALYLVTVSPEYAIQR